MEEGRVYIPGRLEPAAMDKTVAGTSVIYDDDLGLFQSELNAKTIKGTLKVVNLSESIIAEEHPEESHQTDVIYVNDTSSILTVDISNANYRTPNGEIVSITVPPGGYAEANFLNIGETIYVRGI